MSETQVRVARELAPFESEDPNGSDGAVRTYARTSCAPARDVGQVNAAVGWDRKRVGPGGERGRVGGNASVARARVVAARVCMCMVGRCARGVIGMGERN